MTTIIDLTTPEKMDAFGKGLMAASMTGQPVSLDSVAKATNTFQQPTMRKTITIEILRDDISAVEQTNYIRRIADRVNGLDRGTTFLNAKGQKTVRFSVLDGAA